MNRILRAAPAISRLAAMLVLTLGLYFISLQNYLLFHALTELFSATVAFSILILTWNARAYLGNGYLLLVGIASLFTGTFDLLHTLSFKGMGVFPLVDANLPTQLWLAARYLQSLSFLAAPLFIRRRLNIGWMITIFSTISILLLLSIFKWNIFPVAYVEGSGLTVFKIVSEYVIILLYCFAAWLLWHNRNAFDLDVRNLLLGSIFASIITEIFFTTYIDVTDFSNLAGHYFKIVAFYFLYKAIIQTGFVQPYNIIFRNLKQSEAALIHSRDELEDLVLERTRALQEANRELRIEVQERAEVQSALGRQQALLQAVFQQAADGILVSNMQGQITMLNAAVMRITQIDPSKAMSFTPENLGRVMDMDGNEVRAENWPLNLALRGETTVGQEYQMTRPQGSVYNILLSAAPLSDVNDDQIGAVAVFADITRQKQAEEGLRAANLELESRVIQRTSQLERSNRELQEFAYVASHDLQEPLRKIIAFADRLNTTLDENLNQHERDYLQRMQNAASRMREMIDDLLSLSRITTKARPFICVDLADVAREVLDDLEIAILESQADIQIDELPTIQADPSQMHQLLQNLLGNAIKFRHPNQPPRIRIYSRPAANEAGTQPAAEILVEDNGIGFDEKYRERVFQPFSRLVGMNEYKGSGMGLAICQKIVQRHGGTIAAHSTPGVGTQFIVTLPFTPAEPE